MAFTARQLPREEFVDTYFDWCDRHDFARVNENVLPDNVFVCYALESFGRNRRKIPVYCFWLYTTDSGMAILAWPASNREYAYDKRQGGMLFLLDHIEDYCKENKITTLLTTSGTESVIEALIKSGYMIGDSCVQLIKKIQ